MIEIDKGQHIAMIQLSLMGVSVNVHIDMNNIRKEHLLQNSRLSELSPKRLVSLLEFTDHTFKVDPKSVVPWRDQFLMRLSKNCDELLSLPKTLSVAEMDYIRKTVKDSNMSLAKAAKVVPEMVHKAQKISYQYHDGFNHLTRDDDFIAVRAGRRIVGMIPLPGNDFNELKKFLKLGGDRVLEPENVAKFLKAVKEVKRNEAMQVIEKHVSKKSSFSLKIEHK